MSKMQSPDEGDQRAHLPQAAEVAVPEVRQGQDAEAEVTCEYLLAHQVPTGFQDRGTGIATGHRTLRRALRTEPLQAMRDALTDLKRSAESSSR